MRRQHDAAACQTDVIRHDRSSRVRRDAVPDLLDGDDRAQARQRDPQPHAGVVPVSGDTRELSRRDESAVLLERRRQQPDRGPHRRRDLGRARFPRRRSAFIVMVIAVQMVPLNALVIPVYLLLNQVGQVDSLLGVIVYYLAIVLPFMVWTLRGFIANVPVDLEEAAMVDGATRVGAFLRIVFPLVAPGLVATAIYGFIQAWNEYII